MVWQTGSKPLKIQGPQFGAFLRKRLSLFWWGGLSGVAALRRQGCGSLRGFPMLFQPRAIKETLLALDRVCTDDKCRLFPMSEVRGWVREKISSDKNSIVRAIRRENLEPSTVIWVLVTNVLDRELSCGSYHVYRGMLSASGSSLLALWDHATAQLQAVGYHSADEAEQDRAYIREQIKRAG